MPVRATNSFSVLGRAWGAAGTVKSRQGQVRPVAKSVRSRQGVGPALPASTHDRLSGVAEEGLAEPVDDQSRGKGAVEK